MQYEKNPLLEAGPIYESDLLKNHSYLFKIVDQDMEGVLDLVKKRPRGTKRALLKLEEDLNLYLDKNCYEDKQGEFLWKVEKLVAGLYKKIPEDLEKIIERMTEMIMDYYYFKKDNSKERGIPDMLSKSEKPFVEKQKIEIKFALRESQLLENNLTLFRELGSIDSAMSLAGHDPFRFNLILRQLEKDLGLFLDERCDRNLDGRFLVEAKRMVIRLNQKLPEELQKRLERIIDLILDYYRSDYYKNKKEEGREKVMKYFLENAGLKMPVDKTLNKDK